MVNKKYRTPTEREQKIFKIISSADFCGTKEVADQLSSCYVYKIDSYGSLSIKVLSGKPAIVQSRVPVELFSYDSDGVPIHVLLHVKDGFCSELEIYKDSDEMIDVFPSDWDVFVPD